MSSRPRSTTRNSSKSTSTRGRNTNTANSTKLESGDVIPTPTTVPDNEVNSVEVEASVASEQSLPQEAPAPTVEDNPTVEGQEAKPPQTEDLEVNDPPINQVEIPVGLRSRSEERVQRQNLRTRQIAEAQANRAKQNKPTDKPLTYANHPAATAAVPPIYATIDLTMDVYIARMAYNVSVTPQDGVKQQNALYQLIKNTLITGGSDMKLSLSYILKIISEHRSSVFGESLVSRYLRDMRITENEKQFFRCIMAFLVNMSDPKLAPITLRNTDLTQLKHYAAITGIPKAAQMASNLGVFLNQYSTGRRG